MVFTFNFENSDSFFFVDVKITRTVIGFTTSVFHKTKFIAFPLILIGSSSFGQNWKLFILKRSN